MNWRISPDRKAVFDGEGPISGDDSWAVIDMYFKEAGLVSHQLLSFNWFMSISLQQIVDQHQALVIHPSAQYQSDDEHIVYVFTFQQVSVTRPTEEGADGSETPMYPQKARIRNLTYASNVTVNLLQENFRVNDDNLRDVYDASVIRTHCDLVATETYNRIPIGKVPIMVRSKFCWLNKESEMSPDDGPLALTRRGECHYDQGGYFIINGMERCLVGQERMANNFVYTFKKTGVSKYSWIADLRSQQDGRQATSPCRVMLRRPGVNSVEGSQFVVELPGIRQEIPLVILLRALGCTSDEQIVNRVVYDTNDRSMLTVLKPSLATGGCYPTQEVCLDFIARRGATIGDGKRARLSYARRLLQRGFLQHVGVHAGVEMDKAWFLGYMVNRICLGHLGRIPSDCRDHMGKKRIDISGQLLSSSFGSLFWKMTKTFRRAIQTKIDTGRFFDVSNMIRTCSQITTGLAYEMATGNWARQKDGTTSRTGVSQVLNRLTYMSAMSHLRRLNTPLGRDGKLAKPRQLHNTTWGMICPAETPEGQAVGLVKNMSLMCEISVGTGTGSLVECLDELGLMRLNEIHPSQMMKYYKVFMNGKWIGVVEQGSKMVSVIRDLRRYNELPHEISVIQDIAGREIRMFSDSGRVMRPLFVVQQNNEIACTKGILRDCLEVDDDGNVGWSALRTRGVIEFLDPEEEETAMIATFVQDLQTRKSYCGTFTHCEIHPSMILGVCASVIPFPDHNQSPRNVYQSAMGKQAMGIYATNYGTRLDTSSNVLFYPQKPLVMTKPMRYFQFNEMPSGINCMVAIMCYTGYNQEDSLILSQSAIDRGLFRSVFIRCYSAEEKQLGTTMLQVFARPDPADTIGLRRGDYSKLDSDGLIEPGSRVTGDDVIIGKVTPVAHNPSEIAKLHSADKSKQDCSVTVRSTENGAVDQVVLTINKRGQKLVKVRMRSLRIPQIGDKFASRHGQKGTIGLVLGQEDLPFNRDGICPDIIMNPHAIPSRMTIGHLIECLLGKLGAIAGFQGDSTPFCDQSVWSIAEALHKQGYQRYGNERLTSGFTGVPLDAPIFFGPTYYQRLKHMVDDKIHSRARGPVTMLTRQPLEGRGRDGGLRFGEMERDCMISHGAASMLKERLFYMSDAYRLHICEKCSAISEVNPELEEYHCRVCSSSAAISQVFLPYACKLLIQELLAMHIHMKLTLTDGGHRSGL
eukprot:GHVH01004475.1.p1 GENE.GHVH01004475.1~~GHVH01004475.1.p1  ORF type:complete len:1200 (+),score=163.41 GHVH01004475.1:100-3699(+)